MHYTLWAGKAFCRAAFVAAIILSGSGGLAVVVAQ